MANPATRFAEFLVGVRDELKQVTWPTRDEVVGSVLIVFVGVGLLAIYIGLIEIIFSGAARFLLR